MSLLLLLVPVFVVVFRLRLKKQRQDMELFGVGGRARRTNHVSMEPWRLGLLVLATIFIILALTRPAINPHAKMIPREGRDVVFLLDVSKSMLAEDRLPNRLASAKASIAECVNSLDDHRVGLVVFAGSSSIVCPLTMDTDFFLSSLEKAGPDSVAHGGTRIGDALLKVCDKLFSDNDQGYKDIVLISDGGDQSEGVAKAIEEMNLKQVRLIAIGVGDPNQGARIPMQASPDNKSDYLLYKKQVVWSKLDGAHLSEMVKQCNQGAYLPVGTRQMHLDQIYHRLSEQGGTQQLAEESVIAYDDIFQWFVALAFLLLVLMALVPHTKARQGNAERGTGVPPVQQPINLSVLILAITLTLTSQSDAAADSQDPQTLYQKGNTQYRAGEFSEAVTSYEMALRQQPSGPLIRDVTYNLGNAYFKASKKAETSYESLSLVNQSVTMYRRVLLQNRNDHNAAVNNELARVERRVLAAKIKEDEKRRQEMQVALDEIREELVELITAQRKILPGADEPEDTVPERWGEDEQKIADGTDQVATLINKLNETFFKGIPREFTPVAETKKHVATAFLNQNQSILVYQSQWADALAKGRASLQALQDALAALPQEPDDQSQSSDQSSDDEEGDDSESGDGDSSEGDEGESEDGEEGEMESSDATQIDLESIDLPPPSNSPEDVIRMSQEMQNARQAAGAKKKGKAVEKDW